MDGLENHEQLACTNHDLLHKSEVNPPADNSTSVIPQCGKQ